MRLGFLLALWASLAWLAAMLFQYVLWSVMGKDAPWYADLLGGLVSSPVLVPAAAICWILRICGVEAPFVK